MNHYTAKFARAEPSPPASTNFTGNVTEHINNKAGVEIGRQRASPGCRCALNSSENFLIGSGIDMGA